MDKQRYIDYLSQTSMLVSRYMVTRLEGYSSLSDGMFESVMMFVRQRLGKPMLKPALLRAAYEVAGGQNWERTIPACAAFELLNVSSYQANAALDGKLGVLTEKQRSMQFLAAMLTRELAESCIDDLRSDFAGNQVDHLTRALSLSNRYIYIAQHLDVNVLILANADRYRDPIRYSDEYLLRCRYGSGVFSGQCAMSGAVLADAGRRECQSLDVFALHYGTALHMINDLGDFLLPSEHHSAQRSYQDAFSDVRNGRLTLPVFCIMNGGKRFWDEAQDILSSLNTAPRDELMKRTADVLRLSGALRKIRMCVAREMQMAVEALEHFRGRDGFGLLRAMASVGTSNKFFAAFKEEPSAVEKSSGCADP